MDVQLPQRRELSSNDSATPSGVSDEAETAFCQEVTSEFASLWADSLPPDGPVARLLHDSPFRVKLRLKEGVQSLPVLYSWFPNLHFVIGDQVSFVLSGTVGL